MAIASTDAATDFGPATGRGRDARNPLRIGVEGWKDILWRVASAFGRDRVMLVAAGATFYLLLALFPALAVLVSSYGIVADRGSIVAELSLLAGVLPGGALDLIRAQLETLASQSSASLSVGFISGFLVALWSANNGVKTLFEAVNIAYEEREKRSFVRLNLVAFVFTLGSIFVAIAFVLAVGVVPVVLAFVGLDQSTEWVLGLARWPVLFLIAATAISLLYRYGPSRERARWRWITIGGLVATLLWLAVSIVFSWYLANFANYNATYGSLGAIIGFMMWTWVSMVVLIMGAELDAELEHQTLCDSTTGPERPMGQRGATMADTVGRGRPGAPEPELAGMATNDSKMSDDDAEADPGEEPESDGSPRRTGHSAAILGAVIPLAALAAGWLMSRPHRGP
jgi:membrane protein